MQKLPENILNSLVEDLITEEEFDRLKDYRSEFFKSLKMKLKDLRQVDLFGYINEGICIEYMLSLSIPYIQEEPLAPVLFGRGFLLLSILRLPKEYWIEHKEQHYFFITISQKVLYENKREDIDDILFSHITNFLNSPKL